MNYRGWVEVWRSIYKTGFAMGRTTLDLVKVGTNSYLNMYELYMRHLVPSETFEAVKRTLELYADSQAKVIDSIKKLVDPFEKQVDEIFDRLLEVEKSGGKKSS